MPKPFKPEQFGRYLLTERIATGGMAEIFNAKVFGAMGFEKNLVIKRILPQFAEDTEFLRMFITEAKLVCHLEHPNIVQVHELGEIDGQYYIAMEYVNGIDGRHLWRTLAKRKQRLPGLLALFIVSEFLKGLDFAHRAVGPDGQLLGVVHRDVSPSNILISYRGDVKIGDFGIALVQQESKTQAGVLKGKFGYMSPEQVAGMKVDHRSDIFAGGIVLAELLLGRRLFLGQSDFETLDKVLNVKLDVLDEHENALPPEVVKIVRKALQREVSERYQSAQEACDAITEFLYDRRARITNETLAAFIAEHVAPYLVKTSNKEISAPSASGISPSRSGISPSSVSHHRGPRVPSQILPADDARVTRKPKSEAEAEFGEDDLMPEEGAGGLHRMAGVRPSGAVPAPARTPPPATPQPPQRVAPQQPPPPASLAGLAQSGAPTPAYPSGPTPAVSFPAIGGYPSPAAMPEPAPNAMGQVDHAEFQFGAIPVFEMDDERDSSQLDLQVVDDLGGPRIELEGPVSGFIEGAGEELDLEQLSGDGEELYIPPIPISRPAGASILVSAQLASAAKKDAEIEPDFAGKLSSRTVAKVLFRFSVVNESGLLVLTGAERSGRQTEILEWLRAMQARVNAESDSRSGDGRTCSVHLSTGQPRLIAADRNEEHLVAYMIRVGTLSEKRVEKAILANPHRKPVAALLTSGLISPLHISRNVTAFVLDNVLQTFNWTEGDFSFYRGREQPTESFPSGLDALGLILKGVMSIEEPVLDSYFRQLQGKTVHLNRTPPTRLERFNPDPMLLEAYRALGAARNLDEALDTCSRAGSTLQAKQAVFLLLECELANLG